MDYTFIVRILLALLTGFWIARRFRVNIRGLVVRLMPLKYRMSERSFHIQSRISTALAFILALSIGFILNEGLSELMTLAPSRWHSKTDKAIIVAIPEPEKPENIDLQIESKPEGNTRSIEERKEPKEQQPIEAIKSYDHSSRNSTNYYLQLSAFGNQEYAWSYFDEIKQHFPGHIYLGKTLDRICPYKILLGPFASRQETINFKVKYQLNGFPRRMNQQFLLQ